MAFVAGIALMLSGVLDALIRGFTGIHAFLFACGLLMTLAGSGFIRFLKYAGSGYLRFPTFPATLLKWLRPVFCWLIVAIFVLTAIFVFPTDAGTVQRGIAGSIPLHAKGDTVAAYEALQKLTQDHPLDINADIRIGMNFYQEKRMEEAVRKFAALQEREPYHQEIRYNLARCRMALKDWPGALADLKALTVINPNHASALEALGDVYWEQNDQLRAIYYYDLSAREAPRIPSARIKLGFAYMKTDLPQHALLEFERARIEVRTKEEKDAITELIRNAREQILAASLESVPQP